MKIKSYKKIRGNLYRVTLSSGDNYDIYDDLILKYELLIDGNLDEKILSKILEENEVLDAYYKAIKYINIKMRTEYEIDHHLKKYDFSDKTVKETLARLRREGYINPQMYVEAYINDSIALGSNGPKKIKSNIIKLGIDEHIIDEYLENIDIKIWKNRIEKIVNKKAKTNKVGKALFKKKVFSDLLTLGYYNEDIKDVLESFELNTDETFYKEANKVFDHLTKKYEGNELKIRFKNKMYAKSFDSDMINEYLEKKSL